MSERRETRSLRGLIIHDDNAKAHRAWMRNEFLLENHVEQYENAAHLLQIEVLATSSCFRNKKRLGGIRFNDDNEMLTAFEQAFDILTKEDFRRLVYSNALMLKDKTWKKSIKIIL